MGTYQRTCEACGSTFEVDFPCRQQKFCSRSCAVSHRNRYHNALKATSRRASIPEPPPEPGVRFIPLTKGKFAIVDEADFADLSQWNWFLIPTTDGRLYASRRRVPEELKAGNKTKHILMHRYLLGEPTEGVDHCDRNGLNNRRKNLRKATTIQNNANTMSRTGSSRFKGVSKHRHTWRATIQDHGKCIRIGCFETEEEAARAYDEAARRLHGEFARVNFPIGNERSALHDD
jgi:hypothetical protein